MKAAFLTGRSIKVDDNTRVRDLISLRLGHLLLPNSVLSRETRIQFANWIEQSVLEPLRPANAVVIEKALTTACEAILAQDGDQESYGHLFLEQLPSAARELVISSNPDFAERCGFEGEFVFEVGNEIKIVNRDLVKVTQSVFATKEEGVAKDVSEKDVLISIDSENDGIVLRWIGSEGESRNVSLPELAVLSPRQEARRNALHTIVARIGATGPDFLYSQNIMEGRELEEAELNDIFAELSNGVATVQSHFIRQLEQGLPVSVASIIPQDISYYERFCGPAPRGHDPESYFREILIPYRKNILKKNFYAGLDICLLGALRDDLAPGQWLIRDDLDDVWGALSSCPAADNPFSLLGALDVALYQQDDARFREFAVEAVAMLSSEEIGKKHNVDVYVLLQFFFNFALDRITLLRDGARYPGYWKRMCAWMQAGIVVRAVLRSSAPNKFDFFRELALKKMSLSGAYGNLIDARVEPMILANQMPPQILKYEILNRLRLLKWRHENEGQADAAIGRSRSGICRN